MKFFVSFFKISKLFKFQNTELRFLLFSCFFQKSRSRSSSLWSNFLKFVSFCWSHSDTLCSAFASSDTEFLSCWIPNVLISLFILPFSSTVCRLSLWLIYLVESWSELLFATLKEVFTTLGLDRLWDSFVFSHLSLEYFIISVTFARSSSLWSKNLLNALRNLGVNFLKLSGIFVVSLFCNLYFFKFKGFTIF